MHSTKSVIESHLNAFGRRDVAGLLADYTADAVLFTPDGPLTGIGEIRPFFESLVADFAQPGTTFNLRHFAAEGEVGYIIWDAETAGQVYEYATDTFVVRDGRIAAQSFAGSIRPRS